MNEQQSHQRTMESAKNVNLPELKVSLDFATIFGFIFAVSFLALAISFGNTPYAFIDPPSIFIVLGGTLAITTISFASKELARAPLLILKSIFYIPPKSKEIAEQLVRISEYSRYNGLLSLENLLPKIKNDDFLKKCIQSITDGSDPAALSHVLENEIESMRSRHQKGIKILRKAAEVSPAMGLIGTLVGLVQLLGRIDDPTTIGPSMALALLTTLYGALLANFVFSPLAAKLERNSHEEIIVMQLKVAATISIINKQNPRNIEMLLNSLLPPNERLNLFKS